MSTNNPPSIHESIGEVRDLVIEALRGIEKQPELWPQCQILIKAVDRLSQVQIQLGIPPKLAEQVERQLALTKRMPPTTLTDDGYKRRVLEVGFVK